jgi:hypothetical protein
MKLSKCMRKIKGYEHEMSKHDEVIVEWKRKFVSLESECHQWRSKCIKFEK